MRLRHLVQLPVITVVFDKWVSMVRGGCQPTATGNLSVTYPDRPEHPVAA